MQSLSQLVQANIVNLRFRRCMNCLFILLSHDDEVAKLLASLRQSPGRRVDKIRVASPRHAARISAGVRKAVLYQRPG